MKRIYLFSLIVCTVTNYLHAENNFHIETGVVHQTKNVTRVPGNSGTLIKFGEFNKNFSPYIRAEAKYSFSDKHSIRFVYAPLSIQSIGKLSTAVEFNNTTFTADQNITYDYTFNSYRVSYVYSYINENDRKVQFGLTAKLRQAEMKLTQGSTTKSYENTAMVPLLYAAYSSNLGNRWSFYSDIDFLFAPQGRALDFTAKVRKHFSNDIYASLGGRTLEGGADNDKVYTMSWFNYISFDFGIFF